MEHRQAKVTWIRVVQIIHHYRSHAGSQHLYACVRANVPVMCSKVSHMSDSRPAFLCTLLATQNTEMDSDIKHTEAFVNADAKGLTLLHRSLVHVLPLFKILKTLCVGD